VLGRELPGGREAWRLELLLLVLKELLLLGWGIVRLEWGAVIELGLVI
jgi:hypothetical protein